MMLTDSPTPGQPQILAFKINSKTHPHETNSNDSEFFALPRPFPYYINSKGVHKSSRGAAFAEGQWGARPSQEACTYSKLLPLLSRGIDAHNPHRATCRDRRRRSLASTQTEKLGAQGQMERQPRRGGNPELCQTSYASFFHRHFLFGLQSSRWPESSRSCCEDTRLDLVLSSR